MNINPPPDAPLAGYYSLRAADGVADDLFAKALVFEQDGESAAIVVCDLLSLPRHTILAARELITQGSGIPGARVLIAATHQHTGPVVARESARDELDGGTSELTLDYTRRLPALLARAVAEAVTKLAPASVLAAHGHEDNLAFNRRFWMDDGTVAWNPPKLSPRIVAPAGPSDPDVGVLSFETTEKVPKPLATFVNFALHPDTTGGVALSADYPGALARRLAEVRGPEVLTLFANGCCGNLNHRNVWWSDGQHGPGEANRCGTILAGAVCRALPMAAPVSTSAPRVRSEIVALPLPPITEEDLAAARATLRRMSDPKTAFLDKVKCFQVLDVEARKGEPFQVEVQVIALGDEVAFVSLPGEIFVELGLAIKAASPFKHTFLIELANGAIGYIPNRSAYAEGNYEPISARCAEGSGEMLVEAAGRMLRELKAETRR